MVLSLSRAVDLGREKLYKIKFSYITRFWYTSKTPPPRLVHFEDTVVHFEDFLARAQPGWLCASAAARARGAAAVSAADEWPPRAHSPGLPAGCAQVLVVMAVVTKLVSP